jgi:HK97 family phage portal protein
VRGPFGPALRNQTPVPLTPSRFTTGLFGAPLKNDADAQLAATGNAGILWQIIDRIGTSVATPDWHLYRKAKSGKEEDRVEVATHAALDLINKPNPHYTRPELIEAGQQPIDLIGEGILLVTRIAGPKSLPLELWPVRPDRMEPVPHPKDFISHWWYHSPDGEKIRLEVADVLRIKRPNPRDPYRGMGPVQGLLADIDSARYSAEWNRNFFINGAEPGGIIELENGLSDTEFDEMTRRWREQHQGVANAHRVAIIEHGKWVDRKASMKDLQIAELRVIPDEQIRKAFGYPIAMLGNAGDVNRATALAQKAIFAETIVVPRLERWKQLLNTRLLPMYAGGDKLEFDYDNPVPPDAEAINAERDSRVGAAVALLGTGRFAPAAVLEALELPEIEETIVVEAAPVDDDGTDGLGKLRELVDLGARAYLAAGEAIVTRDEQRSLLEQAGYPLDPNAFADEPAEPEPEPVPPGLEQEPPEIEPGEEPKQIEARSIRAAAQSAWVRAQAADDLEQVQAQWEAALTTLLLSWEPITEAQRDQLVAQIRDIVDDGAISELGMLMVDPGDGPDVLADAMYNLALRAAKQTADEASKQRVSVEPSRHTPEEFAGPAAAAAALLAAGLAGAAGREALRLATPGVSAGEVARDVGAFIDELTDRTLRDQLGGQLTAAQNQARMDTLAAAPEASYFATEELDGNTCDACRAVDGRRFDDLEEARRLYSGGGYTRCAGRERCRGTVVALWEET